MWSAVQCRYSSSSLADTWEWGFSFTGPAGDLGSVKSLIWDNQKEMNRKTDQKLPGVWKRLSAAALHIMSFDQRWGVGLLEVILVLFGSQIQLAPRKIHELWWVTGDMEGESGKVTFVMSHVYCFCSLFHAYFFPRRGFDGKWALVWLFHRNLFVNVGSLVLLNMSLFVSSTMLGSVTTGSGHS